MKICAIALVAAVGIGTAGCSKTQDRQAEMIKKFAAIDSAFVADIANVNSNEELSFNAALAQFSNNVMSLRLTLTNLDMATNELSRSISDGEEAYIYLEEMVKATAKAKRSEMTNAMIAAKLRWFYTNQVPEAEEPKSNNISERVGMLAGQLMRAKNDEITIAGLNMLKQSLAAMTNPTTPTEEDMKQAKKEQAAEQQRQQLQAAAIQRSAVRLYGSVFQVLDDGVLIRYGTSSGSYNQPDHLVGFIQNRNPNAFADGDTISGRVAYPIGTYKYDTKGGDTKVVRRFTLNYNDAVAFANGQ
jgi:hypothetical protein